MHILRECAALADAGPKAARQGLAQRAGLLVPNGVVVLPSEPLPTDENLAAQLSGLQPDSFETENEWVVRSSAHAEDRAGHSAAGLFLTLTHVSTHGLRDAIAKVRQSGETELVKTALSHAIPIAVLIQRQVHAARLGVMYRNQHGALRTEERDAAAPEWTEVQVTHYLASEQNPLCVGAARLAKLLSDEFQQAHAVPLYAEYAVTPGGEVVFLQVRPAPPEPESELGDKDFVLPDERDRIFDLDLDHNPDPLSCAQQGLVDAVADAAPSTKQRVLQGYLYVAHKTGQKPLPVSGSLRDSFERTVLPSCEGMLRPLEQLLLAKDGALRETLLSDPGSLDLPLASALPVYRSIYRQYVGLLGPQIRRVRGQVDDLLRANLGEPLRLHGGLLAGIEGPQAERIKSLWALGQNAGSSALLRRVLARFGACSNCWDVLFPCDDEQPETVLAYAAHLAKQTESPERQHQAALARYHDAQQQVMARLPRVVRVALQPLLPLLRDAMLVAEQDDLLFFRAQRLVRWALLSVGARLHQAGRLAEPSLIFELPWRPWETGADPLEIASRETLSETAHFFRQNRLRFRQLVPPQRIVFGRPEWVLPDGLILSGTSISTGARLVTGTALVVPRLDDPMHTLAHVLPQISKDTILVFPTLLPSWAPAIWGAMAVVTDSGGALSHGAILARERGILAVLGTQHATRLIVTGQRLLLDGEQGKVVLSPAS